MSTNKTAEVSNDRLYFLAAKYDELIAELDARREAPQMDMDSLRSAIDNAPQLANKPIGVAEWLDVAVADIEAGDDPITLQDYLRWALEGRRVEEYEDCED